MSLKINLQRTSKTADDYPDVTYSAEHTPPESRKEDIAEFQKLSPKIRVNIEWKGRRKQQKESWPS